MPIEARHLNLTGTVLEGKTLSSKDLVYPMPGSLCMGCSWSLFFAQKINERQFSLSPQLGSSRLISDRSPPLVINPSDPDMLHHYVYVDNLGVIGQNQELVHQGVQAMQDHFNSKELLLHPGEVQCDDIKALGIYLDGRNKRTRVAPERLHKVRQALRCLLRRGRCSGKVLEIVIGHATFCGLGCRLVLSVFHSSYKFIQQHYNSPAVIWDSVLQELRVCAGLMVFLEHNWGKGWNQLVSTSDASETGFGVCTAFWPSAEVAAAGRINERSRFRRTAGHSARESALTSAGFVRDEVSGKWVVNEIDSAEFLDKAGWEVDPCFSEIPAKLLSRDLWTPKVSGTWKFSAHIMELEARALVKSLERICHSRFGHDNHQLLLTDSLSMALAFDRARSRSYRVLQQIRRFAALALSRNVSPHVRWVPSELNSADEPSRTAAADKSKNLIDLIPTAHVQAPPGLGSSSRPAATAALNPASHSAARRGETRAPQEINEQGFACGQPVKAAEQHASEARVGSPRPISPALPCGFKTQEVQQLGLELQQFRPSGSEEDASEPDSETAASPCTLCHRDFGSQVSGVDSSGKESSSGQNRGILYQGIHRIHVVCERESAHCGFCSFNGFGTLPVHDFTVSGGPPFTQGGQAGGCCLPPPCPLQQARATVPPPHNSCHERVEAFGPRSVSQGLASCSLERSGYGNGAHASGAHGAVHFDSSCQLRAPLRTISLQSFLPGPADSSSHGPLGYPSVRPGNGTPFKNWGVRRLSSFGQPLPPALGQALVQGAEDSAQRPAPVGFRILRLFPCLYPGEQETVIDGDAVPAAALRAFNRPCPQLEKLAGSSETWQMEKPEERDQIREIRTAGCQLPRATSASSTPLPARRKSSRGCDVGPSHARDPALIRRKHFRKYVEDLFAGTGGVAHQVRRLGFSAKEWDVQRGPDFDLTSPTVVHRLLKDIRNGRVLAVMMSPPNASLSPARDRQRAIRSKRFPWGLPQRFLTPEDRRKVTSENACLRTCFSLISILQQHKIPWIFAQPASSKVWFFPEMQELQQHPQCHSMTTDLCQFRTMWRKPITLLFGNLDSQDTARLLRSCTGLRGRCSRTDQAHFQLTGWHHSGVRWSQVAQSFPLEFCKHLAFVLTAPSQYNFSTLSQHSGFGMVWDDS